MPTVTHKSAIISKLCSIEVSSRGSDTVIGPASRIDDFVKIKHVGGVGHVIIGSNSHINSGSVIYSGNGVAIGNNVLIGPNCSITPTNHSFKDRDTLICEQGFLESKGGIIIENDVWVGSNVVILDGAVIRKGSVIGANSLVMGELPEYSISFGSPAKVVSYRQ